MQCKWFYYFFYFLTAVNSAHSWCLFCSPPIEKGILSLKGNINLVKSDEGTSTFLHATCLAVMENKKDADMYWSVPGRAGGALSKRGCKIKRYDIQKNENTCTLEMNYSTYWYPNVGTAVTCHAGATLKKVLFYLPQIDTPVSGETTLSVPKDYSWKPKMTTGLNDTIEYTTCENVQATCAIDTAHTDYYLQWLLFNGTKFTILASKMEWKGVSSTATLDRMISSKHDKSNLFCRCWRAGTPPTVCGDSVHTLRLVPKTCSNETDNFGASTIIKPGAGMSRDSHLLTIWLASGVIMITLMIMGTIVIFCCRRSRIRKSHDENMLKNVELNELYAQPMRKSERAKRVESDSYTLPSNESDSVYVYSEFEDDCHTYGNFPILISPGTRLSDTPALEPTYVNV